MTPSRRPQRSSSRRRFLLAGGLALSAGLAGCGDTTPPPTDTGTETEGPTSTPDVSATPSTPPPASPWSETTKLAASDGDPEDLFGWAVALSGDGTVALLGARGEEDPDGDEAGAAYVFERSTTG